MTLKRGLVDEYGLKFYGNKILKSFKLVRGTEIYNLQNQLQRLGFRTKPDGVYGETTERNVKLFQKSYKITEDGIVGQGTINLISTLLNDKDYSNVNNILYNFYKSNIKQKDVLNDLENNKVIILGIRGYMNKRVLENKIDECNDTIVILHKETSGKLYVREYEASTDPGYIPYYEKELAILLPGTYEYYKHYHQGNKNKPALGKSYSRFVRYVQQNNMKLSPSIDNIIKSGGKIAEGYIGINIHVTANKSKIGIWSLGCQTIYDPNGWTGKTYGSFLNKTFYNSHQDKFLYHLIDSKDLKI